MPSLGDVIRVVDEVDWETSDVGVIKYIEPDDEIQDLYWLYIRANDEMLNDKFDPKFTFSYWKMLPSNSPFIISIQ